MIVLILGMTAGQLNCLIVQRLGRVMARLFVSWHGACMLLSTAGAQHAAQFLADEYGHAWVDEYCGLFEAHGEVDAADIPVNNLGIFTRQS